MLLASDVDRWLRENPTLTAATLHRIHELVRWLEPRRDYSVETDPDVLGQGADTVTVNEPAETLPVEPPPTTPGAGPVETVGTGAVAGRPAGRPGRRQHPRGGRPSAPDRSGVRGAVGHPTG